MVKTYASEDTPGAELVKVGEFEHHRTCEHYGSDILEVTPSCPKSPYNECYTLCRKERDTYMLTQYVGATLTTRELNGYHDSDFYAICWDEAEGKLVSIEYATTRFAGSGWAKVDATEEVVEKAAEWLASWALEEWRKENVTSAREIAVDKRVRVTKGRKVAKGTEGTVFWMGEDRYRRGAKRVGFKNDEGETFWTSAGNCEVVNPQQYEKGDYVGVAFANTVREGRRGWHLPFARSGYHII